MYGKFSTLTERQHRAIVAFTENMNGEGELAVGCIPLIVLLSIKELRNIPAYIFHISQFQIAACFILINVIKIFFQDEMS